MSAAPHLVSAPEPELSLPGWIYRDPEFHAVEMERVIRPSWQVVCHVSDIAEPGEWRTLDYLGESVIVLRGDDGVPRPLHHARRPPPPPPPPRRRPGGGRRRRRAGGLPQCLPPPRLAAAERRRRLRAAADLPLSRLDLRPR